jgi:hypothetical protein
VVEGEDRTAMTRFWRNGNVLSIKLRDDLFTLAQVSVLPSLMFFDIANKDGVWQSLDLNNVDLLFCVAVATARISLSNSLWSKWTLLA